ncbi:MAG: molybdopterin-dependent oxidoreductase [Solirubrobacterales bacterium]|nr:molybdopterin-dependent oxidoreductase [Solirubrobacterales bacterium]
MTHKALEPGDPAATAPSPRWVGARVLRREDSRLLTGAGTYVDDVHPPGLLHVAFVRSTEAHAKLSGVDSSAALAIPGVVTVITAQDLAARVRPLRARNATPGYRECDMPVLASETVRMVGEPIALVVARSRYSAEDGAEAVRVGYRSLPALVTIDQALADGAAAIHAEAPGNLFNRFELTEGDVEESFRRADAVVELELRQQRYGAAALEGRAVIADARRDGRLTVWISSQTPHLVRTGLATCLDLPETAIRVISPDVGGGFGPKCVVYPEEVALAAASRLVRAPLKWTSDRAEDLLTTVHGREQVHRVRAAATAGGRLLGVAVDIFASNGAYAPWPFAAGLDSGQAAENICGPYNVPAYRRSVHAVVTNKAPMGPYRGVGRVMACLTMERVMDELAVQLDLDRIEIRRRNVVREFPHRNAAGLVLESGDYVRSLELLEEATDWARRTAANERARAAGRLRGIGIACAVEHSAYGPQSLGSRNMEMTLGYDTASLRVEPDGQVRLAVGLHNQGQGHQTTMAQIAADQLGLDCDRVDVVYGDTDVVPYGAGTWASRSTVYCGGATVLAARDVREKTLLLAADMLEASPGDLDLADGVAFVRGSSRGRVSLADVARRANHEPHLLPAGVEPGLESTRRYQAPDPGSFSSAMHAAEVEIDGETGEVRVLRYVVVEDCGTVVNPMIVEGQVHGGVAQGIGGAVYEHLAYDDSGQLLTTSLIDYLLPGATETPPIEVLHLESPSPNTIGGWKGMGEGGSINAPAAVVSAVNDALRRLGIAVDHTPLTPDWIAREVKRARST